MRTRRLDSNWDWNFGRGRLDYAEESESIEQRIKQILQCYTADWVHDLEYGIDWFGLMDKPVQWAELEAEIKTAILSEYGVVSIDSFTLNFDPDSRHATYTVEVNDIYHNPISVNRSVNLATAR
ncbi:putative baseplate protein 2 [Salmonella phage S144]|uniref:Putative baseplate protein 2 n=1 Tax=Salmonella phage S144 TaxID=2759179 RepID=A0A7G5CF18_9CAUD|nr:putative baseplate protein 2 [Salmonella phage S144]